MKQIYFEGTRGELLKVNCVKVCEDDPAKYQARVMETKWGYYEGECITRFRRHFVHKAGRQGAFLRVHEVQPNELEGNNHASTC